MERVGNHAGDSLWKLLRQDRALQTLDAYGQIEPVEGDAVMAKHPFETF